MAYNRTTNINGTTKYTDLDLSFLPNPSTGDLRIKTDAEAIKQSIKTLLFTNFGERPMQPNLYGGLNELLFEPIDNVTTIQLQRVIESTLNAYEPRINVLDISVTQGSDPNEIRIAIQFTIVNTTNLEKLEVMIGRRR